jgi:hypothetical protein
LRFFDFFIAKAKSLVYSGFSSLVSALEIATLPRSSGTTSTAPTACRFGAVFFMGAGVVVLVSDQSQKQKSVFLFNGELTQSIRSMS